MGFPNRIERTIALAHPPQQVWAALTTAEGLGGWFGDNASIDLRPGGAGSLAWDSGERSDLRVERVEEPSVFGFTWRLVELPDDDPRRTYVEFRLEPTDDGTRLTVTESGFAQLSDDDYGRTYESHSAGWPHELGELTTYLNER